MASNNYKHWRLERDADGFDWLGFDLKDKSANVLTQAAVIELDEIITVLSNDINYQGLAFYSLKTTGFIFGADILNFIDYSVEQIEELLVFVQGINNKIANLGNTVALINGLSLGGGTELALACDYRVVVDDGKLGLPEVTLGILPGWGGTLRLPKLIGSIEATKMMLFGKPVTAKKANAIGLVDAVVAQRQLKNAGRFFLRTRPKLASTPWYEVLFKLYVVRKIYQKILNSNIAKKVNRNHYPAPYKIVANWVKYGGTAEQKLAYERKNFIELIANSDTAKNLIRIYCLQQLLKKQGNNAANDVKRVHVVGAGVMGAEIAVWFAAKGYIVTCYDTNHASLAKLMPMAEKIFKRIFKYGHKYTHAFDRLILDYQGHGIKSADLVIEAVSEDLTIKHKVWQAIEQQASNKALLATNTSSLPLGKIATALSTPSRLFGMHFFNPVSRMPLVEIIRDEQTDNDSINQAITVVKNIGKLPLLVKSSPGFLVNRILMPYIVDAFVLLKEGYTKEEIDYALTEYGMPMGPLELADAVGLDICVSVGEKMQDVMQVQIPAMVTDLVAQGNLGKKSGSGLYQYKKGKIIKRKAPNRSNQQLITDRLIGKMLAEAKQCLKEEVVADQDLLDAGMIFGTGFAPFRGGLLHSVNNPVE